MQSFLERRSVGTWEQISVVVLKVRETHSCRNMSSDLQFMLHHVEGVTGEVDLLDAVDDLLLCLGVDGELSQLPQLLLQRK